MIIQKDPPTDPNLDTLISGTRNQKKTPESLLIGGPIVMHGLQVWVEQIPDAFRIRPVLRTSTFCSPGERNHFVELQLDQVPGDSVQWRDLGTGVGCRARDWSEEGHRT